MPLYSLKSSTRRAEFVPILLLAISAILSFTCGRRRCLHVIGKFSRSAARVIREEMGNMRTIVLTTIVHYLSRRLSGPELRKTKDSVILC
jgi:hypothetical protein